MKKPLTIIASVAVFFSFFLPQTKIGSVSAFEGIKFLFEASNHFDNAPKDIEFYLPFLLLALPICSAIIIIKELSAGSKEVNTTAPKVIIAIVVGLVLVGIIYMAEGKNAGNIIELIGIGFWLSLISAIVLLVTLNMDNAKANNNIETAKQNNHIQQYCSGCGKQYDISNSGEFCENCGTKLQFTKGVF